MKTIIGENDFQVKDLIEDLKEYPPESIVLSIYHDKNKIYHQRPIYKTVETAEPGEVCLYLGDDRMDTEGE